MIKERAITTDGKQTALRLIRGRLDISVEIGGVQVALAPIGMRPLDVDAIVLEEDTYCLLSRRPPGVSPWGQVRGESGVIARAHPGCVRVEPGRPLRLLAIIHDLDISPSWRELWIEKALDAVLAIAEERRVTRLAMPLLGTIHGRHPPQRSLELLRKRLEGLRPSHPRRLWLTAERAELPALAALLRELALDTGA